MNFCLVRPPTFIPYNEGSYPYNLECITQTLLMEGHNVSWVDAEIIASCEIKSQAPPRFFDKLFGLLTIKNEVKKRNKIVDNFYEFNFNLWDKIANNICSLNPDAVGFSCYSSSMSSTKAIVDILREKYHFDRPMILGGIHPTSSPKEVLQHLPGVDYIVIGEGEKTIAELAAELHGKMRILNLVKGLYFKDGTTLKKTEPRELINDLGELPVLSYINAGFDYNHYVVITSRGCPFKCKFCASKVIWGRNTRFRPAEQVVEEIANLKRKISIKSVRIGDDTFTLNIDHIKKIAHGLKKKNIFDINFSIGSRIDTIDEDKLSILKEMNVTHISFGIETGSQRIMNEINKNINFDNIVPTLKMVNDINISTSTYFIINHPGETLIDMKATYNLIGSIAKQCKLNNYGISTGFPYPATQWWDYIESNLLASNIDFYRYSHKYNHQSKPVVNMTLETDKTLAKMKRKIDWIEFKYNVIHKIRRKFRNMIMSLAPRK